MSEGPSAHYDLSELASEVTRLVQAGYDFTSEQNGHQPEASVRAKLAAEPS